jgi:hypothetical protein
MFATGSIGRVVVFAAVSMPAVGCSGAASLTAQQVPRVGAQALLRPSGVHAAGAGAGWISPDALRGAILYGSSYDGGFINLYHLRGNNQQVVGKLTNSLVSPQGMAVDSRANLWVANTNAFNIVAFKRGATTPFRTLDDAGYYPLTVVVGKDGTVYAANVTGTNGPPGNVTVYKRGSTKPTGTLTYSGFGLVLGLGIDAQNNVYVAYSPNGPPAIVEFPAGSQTGQPVNITDISPSDIVFDDQNDLVMENGSGGLGIWTPPYSGGPARSIPAFGNQPTFNRSEGRVWVALADFSDPKILGYDFTTGQLVDTITNGYTKNSAIPYGVAIDPSAGP